MSLETQGSQPRCRMEDPKVQHRTNRTLAARWIKVSHRSFHRGDPLRDRFPKLHQRFEAKIRRIRRLPKGWAGGKHRGGFFNFLFRWRAKQLMCCSPPAGWGSLGFIRVAFSSSSSRIVTNFWLTFDGHLTNVAKVFNTCQKTPL